MRLYYSPKRHFPPDDPEEGAGDEQSADDVRHRFADQCERENPGQRTDYREHCEQGVQNTVLPGYLSHHPLECFRFRLAGDSKLPEVVSRLFGDLDR